MKLNKNERIDDLEFKGLKIIQNKNGFCFGIDSVLLSDFAKNIRNNAKVIDLITCYRISDGEIGLYDLISGQFYTNSGTGAFNKGNDVYVVKDELGKQTLLPAIKEVIKSIDIENKKMIVHLIPGLV